MAIFARLMKKWTDNAGDSGVDGAMPRFFVSGWVDTPCSGDRGRCRSRAYYVLIFFLNKNEKVCVFSGIDKVNAQNKNKGEPR